jgi:hypothetical protein
VRISECVLVGQVPERALSRDIARRDVPHCFDSRRDVGIALPCSSPVIENDELVFDWHIGGDQVFD